MKGLTVRSLSGYDVVYDGETQHLHKPVVIGEILPSGQMQTVWKSVRAGRAEALEPLSAEEVSSEPWTVSAVQRRRDRRPSA